MNFDKGVEEDFPDIESEELVNVSLTEEFFEKEQIMIKISDDRRKLADSAILKSKQHRLKILLDVIAQNCHRIQTILTWMADADGEEALSFTIKQLACKELLSEEQHLKLAYALLEEEFSQPNEYLAEPVRRSGWNG